MYTLHKYPNRNNNKIYRNVIIILSIILLFLISYIFIQSHKPKTQTLFKQQKVVQIKVNNDVQNWKMQADVLKDALQKKNELIVLEGQREVKYTFDYTKKEVQYQGKDNAVRFLVNKLNELKTKEISVQTQYNYIFSYELSNISIDVKDNKLHIILQRGNINLKPLAEDSSKRVISSDVGILSGGNFSPQQTSAVLNVVSVNTYNNLVNDNDLYNKALENAKNDIEELAKKMNINNIKFEILNTGTIANNDVQVINNN